jgi:nucleotide-binding universal stress UspA family protein
MTGDRIVVGFDASPGARAALRWALGSAATDGAAVEAIGAWSLPVLSVSPWGPAVDFDEDRLQGSFDREIRSAVAEVRAETEGAPDVAVRIVVGVEGPALVDAAAGARCLVVGRRGHGGFAGLLLGSVADHCLHHSTVPLALVPPDAAASHRSVVVGVDGSSHAGAALRWGAEEADRRRCPLVALHAWSWLRQPTGFDPGFDDEGARTYAAGLVADALGERAVTVEAVCDLPASALMARSAAGDLVVVGSRGAGAVRQAILGSVSRQLAHHAPGTVVVIRAAS